VSGIYSGSPNLAPEKSISRNVGIVFEPSRNFNIGIDLYHIGWTNIVGSDDFQALVNRADPRVLRDPATGNIITIFNNYRNISKIRTKGVDIDARWSIPTTVGRFGVRNALSYVESFQSEGVEYAGSNAYGVSLPRVKSAFSVDYDQGAWSATATWNFTASFDQARIASYQVPQAPAFQTGVYGPRVRSHETLDLFVRYRTANKWSISASVINAFGKLPPYDPGVSTTFMYDYTQFDVRGRRLQLAGTYKFW
jgi:iron complex outermembrane recepter protein